MINEDSARKAFLNAKNAFDPDRCFPNYVFTKPWDTFLFFPSDWMFMKEFANEVSTIITLEKANTACLLNISRLDPLEIKSHAAIFIDRETTADEYLNLLREEEGSEIAWLYLMEKYILTSDVGSWCMYCEKLSDIAILAITNTALRELRPAIEKMGPFTFEDACSSGQDGVFPFNDMSQEWFDGLYKNYVWAK